MGLSHALSRTTGAVAGAVTTVAGSAVSATSSVAGATSGAAIGGGVGALRGGVQGAFGGAERGTHSTLAMVTTGVALGITGIVDWPLLLVVGGVAAVLNRRNNTSAPTVATGVEPEAIPTAGVTPRTSTPRVRTSKPRSAPAQRPERAAPVDQLGT